MQILQQLQTVNKRLDSMEGEVADIKQKSASHKISSLSLTKSPHTDQDQGRDSSELIELGGLTPKNMFKISKTLAKMVRWLTRGHGFVNYTSQVHLQKTMRAVVNYTDISVPIV